MGGQTPRALRERDKRQDKWCHCPAEFIVFVSKDSISFLSDPIQCSSLGLTPQYLLRAYNVKSQCACAPKSISTAAKPETAVRNRSLSFITVKYV